MDAGVLIQFRVESCHQLAVLSGSHNMSIDLGQGASLAVHIVYIWGPDEGHWDLFSYLCHILLGIETAKLTTVRITPDIDVHRP